MDAFTPNVVAFCCRHSGSAAADSAAALRLAFPAGLHLVSVPCSGKVDSLHVLKAFELGADGVLIFSCPEDNCRHLQGNVRAKKRVKALQGKLEELGLSADRLALCPIASIEPHRFIEAVESMVERVKALGKTFSNRGNRGG
jgi:coenzyme F420-reducing hydrogenase delta subunit